MFVQFLECVLLMVEIQQKVVSRCLCLEGGEQSVMTVLISGTHMSFAECWDCLQRSALLNMALEVVKFGWTMSIVKEVKRR